MERLITAHFVKDFDLGQNGNLYGGRMLDWLDEAGALFVHGLFRGSCFVTWKIGETIFHRAIKHKTIVEIYVDNVEVRTSSVGFDLRAKVNGEEVLTTSMVFVCIDPATGVKRPIDTKAEV